MSTTYDSEKNVTATVEAGITKDEIDQAQGGNTREHSITFLQALGQYPRSVMWSMLLSSSIIMEGYDTKIIGSLFAQPAFNAYFGTKTASGSYTLSAAWQSGLSLGSTVGQLAGLLLAGIVSERFGLKRTMIAGLLLSVALIFIQFFAPNLVVLQVGQILFGVPLGLYQTTVVVYAYEIAPLSLRPYLTNYVNLCWAFGQVLAAGVFRGVLNLPDQWAFRVPFALQWIWPVILIPLFTLAPESPWWLVRQGRVDEARTVMKRLNSDPSYDENEEIALIVVTTKHERALLAGIYAVQTLNGNSLRGYSTYFLTQAGLPTTQAFNMSIVLFAVAIAGGIFSWFLLPVAGRRPIYLTSLAVMLVIMLLVGGLGVPQARDTGSAYSWAIAAILIVSAFVYYATIGPLTNTMCVEISSALVRSKTIALARWFYVVTTIVAGIITPYQLNQTAWNWSTKTGFFWAGGCLISLIFAFFFVPETKSRTTAEMDILFEKGVAPRRFANALTDHDSNVIRELS